MKKSIIKKESNVQSEISFNNEKNKNCYEKCVLCDTSVPILKKTPIEERKNYIAGAGQLCPLCYNLIYGSNNDN